jgi:hypothetical protein
MRNYRLAERQTYAILLWFLLKLVAEALLAAACLSPRANLPQVQAVKQKTLEYK